MPTDKSKTPASMPATADVALDAAVNAGRRSFVLGAAAASSALAASGGLVRSALAQASIGQHPGKWRSPYDPAPSANFVTRDRSGEPMLGESTIHALRQAVARYEDIHRRGGWRPVPRGRQLAIGSRGARVIRLRERLEITGDITYIEIGRGEFDIGLDAAVRKFQIRHGLHANGLVDDRTRAALNVPALARLNTLKLNLPRVAKLSRGLGSRYVVVNIPAAEIEAVENGNVISRHVAVVGKKDRQTPEVSSRISQLNFNPYWHVPVSIVRKDLLPLIRKNPDYLRKNSIRIYKRYNGPEIDPATINWETVREDAYLFRQDPGRGNSMGSVKINFPNKHSVYLHDTPSKNLFGESLRFHSSGCVRVDKVHALTEWLLGANPDWPRARIDEVAVTGDRVDVPVRQPVQLRMIYMTAWARSDGSVHFRRDIYGRDATEIAAASR